MANLNVKGQHIGNATGGGLFIGTGSGAGRVQRVRVYAVRVGDHSDRREWRQVGEATRTATLEDLLRRVQRNPARALGLPAGPKWGTPNAVTVIACDKGGGEWVTVEGHPLPMPAGE
jgi:hypothetical protein